MAQTSETGPFGWEEGIPEPGAGAHPAAHAAGEAVIRHELGGDLAADVHHAVRVTAAMLAEYGREPDCVLGAVAAPGHDSRLYPRLPKRQEPVWIMKSDVPKGPTLAFSAAGQVYTLPYGSGAYTRHDLPQSRVLHRRARVVGLTLPDSDLVKGPSHLKQQSRSIHMPAGMVFNEWVRHLQDEVDRTGRR